MNWKKIDNNVTTVAIILIMLSIGFCFIAESLLPTNELIKFGVYSFIGLIAVLGIWKIFILFTNRFD